MTPRGGSGASDSELAQVRAEISQMQGSIGELKGRTGALETRVASMDVQIDRRLNALAKGLLDLRETFASSIDGVKQMLTDKLDRLSESISTDQIGDASFRGRISGALGLIGIGITALTAIGGFVIGIIELFKH